MKMNVLNYFVLILLLSVFIFQLSCKKDKDENPCNGEASVTVINETSYPGIYVQINASTIYYIINEETYTFIVDMHELYVGAKINDDPFGWEEKVYDVDDCDHIISSWYDSDFQ